MTSVNLLIGSLGGGGAERVISELYSSHPSDVPTTLSIFSDKIAYQINTDNVTILSSKYCKTKLLRLIYLIRPRIIFQIIRYTLYLKKNKVDVSVSFLTDINITNIISCLFTRTKCIVSIRNNPLTDYSGLYGYLLLKISLYLTRYFADHVITNSQGTAQVLIEKCHITLNKVSCIYNPKDIKKIQELKMEEVTEDFFQTNEPILLTAGRLSPQKGHIHLIRIFAELKKTYSCRLVICGVGPLESELKLLVKDLKIEDAVLFLGWCDNIYKYMARTTIFVFPSLYEGQPNALIEALICGCPIVSTDCDFGPNEILMGEKYGLLSMKPERNNIPLSSNYLTTSDKDMYNKIKILLDNPSLRAEYSKKSPERWDMFAKDKIISAYFDIFKDISYES